MQDKPRHPLSRTFLIDGFSELAVWVIRSGPEGDTGWLIEASLVGLKGLDAEIKERLAETHFLPMWTGVLQERFRAEEHGAGTIDLLRRVAGREHRDRLDEVVFLPGLRTGAPGR